MDINKPLCKSVLSRTYLAEKFRQNLRYIGIEDYGMTKVMLVK
jgi:hypothetical protein